MKCLRHILDISGADTMGEIKINFKDGKTLIQELEGEMKAEDFFTKIDSLSKSVRYILGQQPDSFLNVKKRKNGEHMKPNSKEFKEMIKKIKEQQTAGISDVQISLGLRRARGFVSYLKKKGYLAVEAE